VLAGNFDGRNEEKKGIFFRVSESEYQTILKKSGPAGMSVPKFCKHVVLNKRISVPAVDRDVALELANDLRKIGNNINQIARHVNTDNNTADKNLSAVNENMREIWRLFNSVILKK